MMDFLSNMLGVEGAATFPVQEIASSAKEASEQVDVTPPVHYVKRSAVDLKGSRSELLI
jgi:hypothetical protein